MQCSGISYYEAENLVETIVNMKKGKYHFPGHDPEDLAQDIRLVCWESLNKFNPSKLGKSIFHYVARCVDNALYNKFRGVYFDNNPPCLRCDDYEKETKTCKIQESGCDRIVQYRDRMARKRAIAAPVSYSNASLDDESEDSFYDDSLAVGSQTGYCNLDETIRSTIDPNLLSYYDLMTRGHRDAVPAHIRRIIQQQVRVIIDESV